MVQLSFEVWIITLIHISAVVIWIGAHLFENLILHSSLKKVSMKPKLEVYLPLFARFRDVTGLASATTLYSGVLLFSVDGLGSLSLVLTTPWGLLSTLYFIVALANHSLGLKPSSLAYRSLRMLGTFALVGAAIVVIVSISLPTNLRTFIYSGWGLSVLTGSILAVILSRLGIVQGAFRRQISRIASQILSSEDSELLGTMSKRFHSLEHKMELIVMPETILIIVILALMVFAANSFSF